MSIHLRSMFSLITAGACAMAACSVARATESTRYVSISGNNANACTLEAPCRSLQRGINATPAGGELRILNSGNYGNSAIINKSLTIFGGGNTVYLSKAVTVSQAGVVVALRELVLNGRSTVANGIVINAAATVYIEHCVIHGFTGDGIYAGADGASVSVLDSILRDNTNAGVEIAYNARLTADNSRFENNMTAGVFVSNGAATISRSTVSGNVYGFYVDDGSQVTVESSAAHGNITGMTISAVSTTARISNSTFTGNSYGIQNSGGTVETRQNNTIRGNLLDLYGSLTPIEGM